MLRTLEREIQKAEPGTREKRDSLSVGDAEGDETELGL